MNAKSNMMLKALLHAAHPNTSHNLYHFLTPSEEETLKALPLPHNPDVRAVLGSDHWLKRVHYSWLEQHISSLPTPTQEKISSLLTPAQKKALGASGATAPAPFLALFLSDYLKKQMLPEEILPREHLPPSPLTGLLELEKADLIHLIDLLGIYDLAAELRHVVDNVLLGKIYAALTQEQLHFLHYCRKTPMKWVPPKLNISGWDGTSESLRRLLHRRGLVRLAKAIQEEDPSFIWHLCHQLDTGRGQVLLKTMEGPPMTASFKAEVIHVMKRFAS